MMTQLSQRLTDIVVKLPLITLKIPLACTELMGYLILPIFYLTVAKVMMMTIMVV